ncbi:MAG: hypothetical protein IJS60_10110 [Abditibacteriota bacterium]|nr:hypothetical protein [Abditibacteriota bacterium]
MENKYIYLTNIAFKALIGKSLNTNDLAREISPNFKGEILNYVDKNILINDRVWMPLSRKEKENHNIIFNTIKSFGNLLTKEELTHELTVAKNCDENEAKDIIKATLSNKRQFFSVCKKWGVCDFFLNIEQNNEDDVIYRNYIDKNELSSVQDYFKEINFDDENYAEIITNILNNNKIEKLSLKTALFFIWLDNKSLFDNKYIFEDIDKSKTLKLLNGYLFTECTLKKYMDELVEECKSLNDVKEIEILQESDEEEIYETSPVETTATEEKNPIELYDDDKETIINYINNNGFITLSDIISEYYEDLNIPDKEETIANYLKDFLVDKRIETNGKAWYVKVSFEPEDKDDIIDMIKEKETLTSEYIINEILGISKNNPKWPELAKDIEKMLADCSEVSYLGNNTWGLPLDIPEIANIVPDSLKIAEILPSENAEGDVFDQELSPEGFEGTLKTDVYNPLAEDVFDEDQSKTMFSMTGGKQKCVLKYHHKIAGTFPLCQIPPDFFGQKAEVFPITITNEDGLKETVYINNKNRIIIGMAPFYENITDVSGRIFYLEKTDNSNEYKFSLGDTDKGCNIDLNRSMELLEIKNRLETESLTLFDIICEILEKRPIDFIQIVTEVNLVKRASRLLIASILSSYHCFNNNKKNGKWNLDEKKIDLGFNKTKKKYIIKK